MGDVARIGLVACGISLFASWTLIKLATRWRLIGKPALQRKRDGLVVSHIGGLALAVGCFLALAWSAGGLNVLMDPVWAGWTRGALWLLGLGLVDDLVWELPSWVKGAGQLCAAVLLATGGITVQIAHWPTWVNFLVTLVWIVGMTNALNLLDIVDGLATSVAIVAAIAFAWLATWSVQLEMVMWASAVAGALVGFLVFNRPPARLYMGDTGSQWLGFTLGAVALAISYAPVGREVALLTPVIVLGLPIFDLAFVVWMRLRDGRSPFRKSRDHFALRLISRGTNPAQTVIAMAGLAVAFAVAGLLVARLQNTVGVLLVAVVIVAAVAWARRLAAVDMHG